MSRARLAVLISGRGRNLRALIEAMQDGRIDAELTGVISSRADAEGLAVARAAGIPTETLVHTAFSDRAGFDRALTARLRAHAPDIVALAGFMRVLSSELVGEFAGRMLNIHPSLLPRHPGLDTHRSAIAAGDAEHGATVHFVTAALDSGPRVIQGAVAVAADDDAVSLAERVMQKVELKIYPQAVAWMACGDLRLNDGMAEWRGRRLEAPLTLNDLEDAFR